MDFEENESKEQYRGLEELSQSDFEIKDGEPDIIGWNVKNNHGDKLGEVDELIFDPAARKVRYVVLDMEDNDLDLESERLVLIPIGVAVLHTDEDEVIIPNVTVEQLSDLPPYQSAIITPEDELTIRGVFEQGSTAPYEHPQFYLHQHFDEDKFYSRGAKPAEPLFPVDNDSPEDEAARALRVSRIVERINHKETPQREL